ncbi:MAG: quaternary ammonium compound-resistance protein SugE [Candidatus Methanomethylophilaceae archaeon]|nr:quaternary ammonium compound-resistance protein SugE [Candidatus Methanomethylophilaceae archaeon]
MVLIVASCIEPIWVTCLDMSENFKKKGWGIAAVVLVLLCLYLLAYCVGMTDENGVNYIGPGVAYAILAGIGAAGIVAIGRVLYKEKLTFRRMAFVFMIFIGIIGTRLAGAM